MKPILLALLFLPALCAHSQLNADKFPELQLSCGDFLAIGSASTGNAEELQFLSDLYAVKLQNTLSNVFLEMPFGFEYFAKKRKTDDLDKNLLLQAAGNSHLFSRQFLDLLNQLENLERVEVYGLDFRTYIPAVYAIQNELIERQNFLPAWHLAVAKLDRGLALDTSEIRELTVELQNLIARKQSMASFQPVSYLSAGLHALENYLAHSSGQIPDYLSFRDSVYSETILAVQSFTCVNVAYTSAYSVLTGEKHMGSYIKQTLGNNYKVLLLQSYEGQISGVKIDKNEIQQVTLNFIAPKNSVADVIYRAKKFPDNTLVNVSKEKIFRKTIFVQDFGFADEKTVINGYYPVDPKQIDFIFYIPRAKPLSLLSDE